MSIKAFGSIFHRANKQKESHPDANGNFTISKEMLEEMNRCQKTPDGAFVLDFAGWTKQGPKAGKFLSGNLSIARDNSQAFVPKRQSGNDNRQGSFSGGDDDDDTIPF